MYEIQLNSKPRREQGGLGLLSQSNTVQSLHKSMTKIPNSREEKRGTGRRGWRQGEEGGVLPVLDAGKREREREKERERG